MIVSNKLHATEILALGTAATSLWLSGCLCPTCAQAPGAATPATAQAAPATETAAASASAADPQTVIWDGENAANGQSWASCDNEGKCQATLAVANGEGKDGGIGLKFHGEGPGWKGAGWNWHGWYPKNAGTDLSVYDDLKLSVKITAASKDALPDLNGVNIALGCSANEKSSADAPLGKYASNAADGNWHDVTIPLSAFFDGDGKECDARTAWEFRVGSWSQAPVNFDLVVDNITAAKR